MMLLDRLHQHSFHGHSIVTDGFDEEGHVIVHVYFVVVPCKTWTFKALGLGLS